ncbi:cystathionine gamma-synthase [Raineyella fluvialis]|uniref:Cystathionine gamma-synthase n=1 Tax=Raineyella fluvialis TaxID=2662261 RepID=A0A5Q2FJQ9_9ACTN|nr:cystathionine gamma-synthase [Raineyella fluvialis]QGF24895.1 cystathionine gamma-synthase [Raineyella fluvialis]
MEYGFSTRAIRAGQTPDPVTGAVVPPLYLTSTFVQDGVGRMRGDYEYSRAGNPTRTAAATQLAALEQGTCAFITGSGMSAADLALRTALRPGGRVILGQDAYGGTTRLLTQVLESWGIETVITDPCGSQRLEEVLARPVTGGQLVWVETPSNPLLHVCDIAAVAQQAHAHGARVVVDNTFASPYLQNPLALGADVVVHSTTKYLGGHSDLVGGAIVVNDDDLAERLTFLQNAAGYVSSPFDAWLLIRGMKTLSVRMDRHCANAGAVAAFLDQHPRVSRVHYPGLESDPGHDVATRQMRAYGGMVSFHVAGGREESIRVASATKVFLLAESLGGVESLVEHPAAMTHASVEGTASAVDDDLLRLSVGIEDIDDLIADLDRALG